jgi:hypothetical protein
MWTKDQIRMMIDERKRDNVHYHGLFEGKRRIWWKELAAKINLTFGMKYSGKQVNDKFQSLVRDTRVSKIFKIFVRID